MSALQSTGAGARQGSEAEAGARRRLPADLQGAVVLQDLEAIPGRAGRTHDLFLLVAHIAAASEDSAPETATRFPGGAFPSLSAALHSSRPCSMCRQGRCGCRPAAVRLAPGKGLLTGQGRVRGSVHTDLLLVHRRRLEGIHHKQPNSEGRKRTHSAVGLARVS